MARGPALNRYNAAIIFPPDDSSLIGEPEWAVRQAEAAGVIYHCTVGGGSCGVKHVGGADSPFWHYCEGKTDADYDAVTEASDAHRL
jgi:hypothetical protein